MPEITLPRAVLHYEQFGSGPDIVWVAGGGGRGLSWHRYQIPEFETDFRCTTFDSRGIGLTRCEEPLPWSIADMADDTAVLIEAVCDPPVVVVGHSMGGFIVTELALGRPDLLRGVIASGTAGCEGAAGWATTWARKSTSGAVAVAGGPVRAHSLRRRAVPRRGCSGMKSSGRRSRTGC